jgi:hypothetical protein
VGAFSYHRAHGHKRPPGSDRGCLSEADCCCARGRLLEHCAPPLPVRTASPLTCHRHCQSRDAELEPAVRRHLVSVTPPSCSLAPDARASPPPPPPSFPHRSTKVERRCPCPNQCHRRLPFCCEVSFMLPFLLPLPAASLSPVAEQSAAPSALSPSSSAAVAAHLCYLPTTATGEVPHRPNISS